MTRFLYNIGLIVGCMGLPLQAKGLSSCVTQPAPAETAKHKTGVAVSTSTPSTAKTKAPGAQTVSIAKTAAPVSTSAPGKAKTMATTMATSAPKSGTATGCGTKGRSSLAALTSSASSSNAVHGGRLARLTAYWAGEGDYYTGHGLSSTGIRLHDGYCAVDPRIIPYGSVVTIAGLGKYLAVDTGSAVISRDAAIEAAHNAEERNALVIDLYFESRRDGQEFAASGPKYASITWEAPRTADNATKESIGLVAEENWNRSQANQL